MLIFYYFIKYIFFICLPILRWVTKVCTNHVDVLFMLLNVYMIYCYFVTPVYTYYIFQIIYQPSSFSKWFASFISIPKGSVHCWASKSWGNIWKDITAYSRSCTRWSNGWPEWNKSVLFPYFSVLKCICLLKSFYFKRHLFSESRSQLQNHYIELSEVFDFAKKFLFRFFYWSNLV